MRIGLLVGCKVLEQRFGVVCSLHDVGFLDGTRNGSMPSVVRQSTKERLVDCTADKLFRVVVKCQDIKDRVWLTFHPELLSGPNVLGDLVHLRLARIDQNIVVFWFGDGSSSVLQRSREEVVPGLVTVVLGFGIAVENLVEFVVGTPGLVGNFLQRLDTVRREPAFVVGTEDGAGFRRGEEFAPVIENAFELMSAWLCR